MQLRVRIDDVLINGSGTKDPEKRFAQITRWLEQTPLIEHVPTILVEDIQKYPNTIKLIQEKTKEGKMFPQLHGWQHVGYGELPEKEIIAHLEKCFEWFNTTLGYSPTIWATPWGGENEKLDKIADIFGMKVEGVKNCYDPGRWLRETEQQNSPLFNVTVMEHWWVSGLKLLRISNVIQHRGYKEAKLARPDLW